MKYIIDLDGTLMNNDKPNKDAVAFINELQKRSAEFIIMTNAMAAPATINKRLENVGINIESNQIMNPISVINQYNKTMGYQSGYIVGSALEISQVVIPDNKENPEIIILLDFEKENIGFSELQIIFEFLQQGIPMITASKSPYYLKDHKRFLDTGSFVKLFEAAANIHVNVLGKPSEEYFKAGVKLLNAAPHEVTVIGDDWRTDSIGANNVGCNAILMKSGKYEFGDELKCPHMLCVDYFAEILENK